MLNIFLSNKGGVGKTTMAYAYLCASIKQLIQEGTSTINLIDLSGRNMDLAIPLKKVALLEKGDATLGGDFIGENFGIRYFTIRGKDGIDIRVIYPPLDDVAFFASMVNNPVCFIEIVLKIMERFGRDDSYIVETSLGVPNLIMSLDDLIGTCRSSCCNNICQHLRNNYEESISSLYNDFFRNIQKRFFWIVTNRFLQRVRGARNLFEYLEGVLCPQPLNNNLAVLARNNRIVLVINYYYKGARSLPLTPQSDIIEKYPVDGNMNPIDTCNLIRYIKDALRDNKIMSDLYNAGDSLKEFLNKFMSNVLLNKEGKSEISLRGVVYSTKYDPKKFEIIHKLAHIPNRDLRYENFYLLMRSVSKDFCNEASKNIFFKITRRGLIP